MSRKPIIQRLLYLRNWEFLNIFLLPACLYIILTSLQIKNWQPYAYSMLLICIVLAQGVLYWHLKLQSIYKSQLALPAYFRPVFLFFKWLNIALLFSYFILNRLAPLAFHTSTGSHILFIIAFIEYINYYHYQLSHDNLNDIRYLLKHKKIRKSPLAVDLQKTNA